MEVSLIIATLNGAKDLPRLFDTLLKQETTVEFEVILVNGPSTDNTLEVANSYLEKLNNLKILNVDFKHTLKARKVGIKEAKGRYVSFLDSDDYVSPYYVQKLYDAISKNDADVASASLYYDKEGRITKAPFAKNKIYLGYGYANELMKDLTIRGFMHTRIYKKELFDYVHNFYPKNVSRDDMIVNFLIALHVKKFVLIKDPIYYYVKNPNQVSITNTKDIFRIEFLFIQFFMEKVLAYENGDENLIKGFHKARLMRFFHYVFEFYFKTPLEKKEKRELHKKLKGYFKLLNKKEKLDIRDTPYNEYEYLIR